MNGGYSSRLRVPQEFFQTFANITETEVASI